jgi:hypothetical protein
MTEFGHKQSVTGTSQFHVKAVTADYCRNRDWRAHPQAAGA